MKTIVVIPAYHKMNALEKISLQQAVRVFRDETLCLAVPTSLDVSSYLTYGEFHVERFADRHFESVASYSNLLLTPAFYERFAAYDYLLIYQLDAFAFRDALPYFCGLGYDYFGAPWGRICTVNHRLSGNPVGNGGFSLRHIRHTIAVLQKYHDEIEHDWKPFTSYLGEDIFFSWAAMQAGSGYTTAPLNVAKTFALQLDIQHAFRDLNEETLPFGVHGWYRSDAAIWIPQIERCGYHVERSYPQIRWRTSRDVRRDAVHQWALERILKRGQSEHLQEIVRMLLPVGRKLYLRGNGLTGARTRLILRDLGIRIDGLLERGDPLPASSAFLLIASVQFEDEIAREFVQAGRVHERDFLTSREFEERFLLRCYERE